MNKLLHAGFYRFKKSRIYAVCLAGVLLYGIFVNATQYFNKVKYGYELTVDPLIFNFLTMIGVVFSVFIGLYVGTEYGDGTIRNKLIVGMSRTGIYLSNLIICTAGGMIIIIAAYILNIGLGIPLFGTPEMGAAQFAVTLLNGICLGIAYISIFNMIAMINSNKTNGAVLCILAAFAIVFIGILLFSQLSQPEFVDRLVMKDGESMLETVKNSNYLSGTKREIYQNMLELLPSGQAMMLVNHNEIHPLRMIAYSGLVTVVTNVIGISIFRRKDIK